MAEQRIVPFLGYADAAAAIDWLCAAFGAVENAEARQTGADGTIGHAELDFGGAKVFLSTPSPHYQGPRRHRASCEAAARWQDNPWVIDGLFVAALEPERIPQPLAGVLAAV